MSISLQDHLRALSRPATPIHAAMALTAYLWATYGNQSAFDLPLRSGGLSSRQLQQCLEMIEDYLDTDISLAMLAQPFHLSTRHFTRLFVRSTGVPPYRYLLGRRIARARVLLKDPALTLSSIAQACGFADQSHFTRVFTGTLGVSPGAFRRELMH